jgi:hypothetical protein
MFPIPLGGRAADYNSKKAAGTVVNMYATVNNDKSFKDVNRTEGLKEACVLGAGPIRSDLITHRGYVYAVSGGDLYRFDKFYNVESLGSVGGGGRCVIVPNSDPSRIEMLILNGDGDGFVFIDDGATETLTQITDPNFTDKGPTSATILNEIFWAASNVRGFENQFIGSGVSDGTQWPTDRTGLAEEHPDAIVGLASKKSSLWIIGERTVEYWQTASSVNLPLRRTNGTTQHFGCASKDSISALDNGVAFFTDDRRVMYGEGGALQVISDLNFELKVRGNGTTQYPGFKKVDDAYGFWIDATTHKTYVLTFPSEKWTWCFDIINGLPHIRESWVDHNSIGLWRVNSSVSAFETILGGDYKSGKIWELSLNYKTEGDHIQVPILRTVPVGTTSNLTIPYAELDMEVGVGNVNEDDPPLLQVRISKDGGYTFTNAKPIDLGKVGNYRKRVPIRQLGRLVRFKELVLEFRTTAPVRLTFYDLQANIQKSMYSNG